MSLPPVTFNVYPCHLHEHFLQVFRLRFFYLVMRCNCYLRHLSGMRENMFGLYPLHSFLSNFVVESFTTALNTRSSAMVLTCISPTIDPYKSGSLPRSSKLTNISRFKSFSNLFSTVAGSIFAARIRVVLPRPFGVLLVSAWINPISSRRLIYPKMKYVLLILFQILHIRHDRGVHISTCYGFFPP